MTVDELLERMSSQELTEWMALHALEGKEQELVTVHKVDPETAHTMIWGTSDDALDEE